MASSNLVSIIYAPESVYGVTDLPLSGVTAYTARFTSEGLSGTPTTTESEAIRTDRQSGGQVVTGLEVNGPLEFELAADKFFDDFFEAGMFNDWVAASESAETVTLTPDGTDDQLATLTISGDFGTIGVQPNDYLQLLPATGSPVTVVVVTVDSATECTVATTKGQAPITGEAYTVSKPQYVDIGITKTGKSFVVGKAYKDVLIEPANVNENGQTYNGEFVSTMSVSFSAGEIVTGTFNLVGNGYKQEFDGSLEQQIVNAGGTVNPPGTSNPLNASIDVPVVTSDGTASTWCLQSFTFELDSGLDPELCVNRVAPRDYALGQADISVTATIYHSSTSHADFMPKKLTQEPVSLSISSQNAQGGYAFAFSAVQLSFPDPSSGGRNQSTFLNAEGLARVGLNGESAMRIYKLKGDQ